MSNPMNYPFNPICAVVSKTADKLDYKKEAVVHERLDTLTKTKNYRDAVVLQKKQFIILISEAAQLLSS